MPARGLDAVFLLTGPTRELVIKESIKRLDATAEYLSSELCHILEISNSADDEDASITRARVEPGVVTRWHRLVATTERYVILEGTGRVEVGTLGPQDVSAGDVVIIPPLCPQRIGNTGQRDLVFLAVCTPRFRQQNYEDIEGSDSHE